MSAEFRTFCFDPRNAIGIKFVHKFVWATSNEPGSNAARHGITAQWVLHAMDGEKIVRTEDAIRKMATCRARDEDFMLTFEIPANPRPLQRQVMQFDSCEPLGICFDQHFDVVHMLKPGGQAQLRGVSPGWKVVEHNGEVVSAKDVITMIEALRKDAIATKSSQPPPLRGWGRVHMYTLTFEVPPDECALTGCDSRSPAPSDLHTDRYVGRAS